MQIESAPLRGKERRIAMKRYGHTEEDLRQLAGRGVVMSAMLPDLSSLDSRQQASWKKIVDLPDICFDGSIAIDSE